MTIEIQSISGGVGVELANVDMANVSDADLEVMKQAFVEHGLVFLRGQDITPEQHIAFA